MDREPEGPIDERKTWLTLTVLMALWMLLVAVPLYRWFFA